MYLTTYAPLQQGYHILDVLNRLGYCWRIFVKADKRTVEGYFGCVQDNLVGISFNSKSKQYYFIDKFNNRDAMSQNVVGYNKALEILEVIHKRATAV